MNIGALLGLVWGLRREKRSAAESKFVELSQELDVVFQAMQDVIVDDRDGAIASLNDTGKRTAKGVPVAFRSWARKDTPRLAALAARLRERRRDLILIDGIELISGQDRKYMEFVHGRFTEIEDFINQWIGMFRKLDDQSADWFPEFQKVNNRWIEMKRRVDAEAASHAR